jgi:ankyrin repeat protein
MNDDWRLVNAIFKNDIPGISSLIASGLVNLSHKPFPLHRATSFGHVEIMTVLLDAGADINAVDDYQRPACCVAIMNNQFDALKLLVERGANLSVVDSEGNSLLSFAANYTEIDQFTILLLDAGAPLDSLSTRDLMKLVKSVPAFKRLLARAINLTTMRDEDGATLCHHVVGNVAREDDLCVLLDTCGRVCDAVNAVDGVGEAPLHRATSNGNETAMRILVEMGASIDQQNHDGESALHCAARENKSCVELLLALGADVCLFTKNGMAACHLAAGRRMSSALCALVAAGGDLDQPNNNDETPRMIAVRRKNHLPTTNEIVDARHLIAKRRLDLVRSRALEIGLGLQSLNLNALQLCEIMMHSFGAIGSLIAFHQWWAIATKVKHFANEKTNEK